MGNKKRLQELIDAKADKFTAVADHIWDYAETRFGLKQSADALCAALESEGFTIDRGIAGMAHAFKASFGSGGPKIGILAEYDALAALNQVSLATEKKADNPGGNGHGCGHHLLGAGSLAGAVGIKDYMQENKLSGTIVFIGCPAEESGSGKAYLGRAGAFNGYDAFLTWHPMTEDQIMGISSLANYQVYFSFKGVSSHAAAAPQFGRSALDAMELMSVGVNYLREHIIQEARIHYAYLDVGGAAPNVVQPTGKVLYFIRAPHAKEVEEIFKRVVDIAKGAALMTGTTMEQTWDSACAEIVVNDALSRAMYDNLASLGKADLSAEEKAFAKKFTESFDEQTKRGTAAKIGRAFPTESPEKIQAMAESPILEEIYPYFLTDQAMPASSDVGDASWHAPTAQFTTAAFPLGTNAHSWQWVSCGKSSVAHKSVVRAGKVLAMTALDLLEKPELLEKATAEYTKRLGGAVYKSPIPAEVKPEE